MNYPRANYPARLLTDEQIELALAAIWEVLNTNGLAGWNDWYAAAASGEWQ